MLLRDVGTAETAVEKITQERDHQKAQLAATEMCIKSLQTEKRSIGQQRDQAIAQLATTDARAETLSQENKALLEENQELRAHIAFLMQGSAAQEDMSHHSTLDNADADATEGPLDMDTISLMNQQKAKELQKERVQVQDKPVQHHDDSLESSHNITYLSYAGDSSMCKVRKTLEQERRARQQRRQADAAGNAYVSRVETQKEFGVQAPNEQSRECSESSVIKRPKRSSIPREELTSGFIVPDITFDQQRMTEAQASLELPANTQHHSDLVQQPQPSEQIAESRQQVQPEQVAGPRQITDEELDITIHDEEPTIRPTQAPEVALAVVLESLGAELAEQRAQLAKYQNSYARQDVTISRRQRKQIHAKIQALLDACEVKAEQIYNLHDVIEGQKQQGPPVTHDQIDNTLQSLGLDLPWEGLDSRRRSTASSRSI